MASVLAIVSKALFEKMVPGKEELGVVVETDQYVSANKAFDQLTPDDAIFLVTVRPPKEDLWLVGILEAPKKNGKAWTSASANTVPLTDITSVLRKLELASGEGITAKKGTLGMSLQTPRVLTENDDAAIRDLIKGWDPAAKKVKATQDYAEAVAAGPKKKRKDDDDDDDDIVDEGAPVARPSPAKWAQPAANRPLGALRLDNYRKPFAGTIDQLTPAQRTQLEALIASDLDSGGMTVAQFFSEEMSDEDYPLKAVEWMDVVEIATNEVVADLLIFPYGDGCVLKRGTETMLANIVQHGITPAKTTTKTWMTDFAKAWWEGAPRLKVDDVGHFGFRPDQLAQDDDDGASGVTTKPTTAAKQPAATKPATKKPPTKKPPAKKPPAKKAAPKTKAAPKKTATKKPWVTKPAANKPKAKKRR